MAAGSTDKPHVRLRRKAMDYLARREHSFEELRQKLAETFPDDDASLLTDILARLRDENLQSDSRFVESYVRFRSIKGHGPLKISAELQQKGVDAGLVRDSLYAAGYDWRELAQQALRKRFGGAVAETRTEQQKQYRFLAQRGFASEDIQALLRSSKPYIQD